MARNEDQSPASPAARRQEEAENGAAMAALLAAGIGAFAMGSIVILGEAKLFTAPSLYRPAGGLSGRATIAVLCWLISWGIAHRMWSGRRLDERRIFTVTLVLIALGLLAVFPPVWGVF